MVKSIDSRNENRSQNETQNNYPGCCTYVGCLRTDRATLPNTF